MSFIVSFITLFLAELGDKTQLVAMHFASKYNHFKVIISVIGSVLVLKLLQTLIGNELIKILPNSYIKPLAGVIFIICALLMLLKPKGKEEKLKEKWK